MTPLWDWALNAYARPGAEPACLALQDHGGQNIPLLLWAFWAGEAGRNPDLQTGAREARRWEADVLGPLRGLRRALKASPDPDFQAVRAQIKTVELDAERRLLGLLEGAAPLHGPPPAAADLLSGAALAYGAPLPPEAFHDLLRALNPSGS